MKLHLHRRRPEDSDGMTLIEVVVAISIMGIIATAAVGLSITSQAGAAAQQRQELAVTIANQAMENVSAQAAGTNPATGSSYLFQGRTQAAVATRWAANAAVGGLADTYPGWDTASLVAPPEVIPMFPAPIRQSGTDYAVDTLIGTCYQATSGAGNCIRLGSGSPPPSAPANTTQLIRVTVVVRWSAGTGCAASGCTYQTTSLVDPHLDLQWNSSG